MEARDRLGNLLVFALAIVAWALVGIIVTTTYPDRDSTAAISGAGAIGVAAGLTLTPVCWLAVFTLHRRIAYRGDWTRALRRGAWIGGVVALLVALRVQGAFSVPIGLFVIAMAALAEAALSVER